MSNKTTNYHQETLVVELYKSGLSMQSIEDKTGIGRMVVTRVLKDWNVEMRSSGGMRPYFVDSHAFDNLSLEKSAYWFGFLFADGSISKSNLDIILSSKDVGHLLKLAEFLRCDKTVVVEKRGKYEVAMLRISDRPLANRLNNLGLKPHRPHAENVFKHFDATIIKHFIRGYFDGDGCAYKKPQLAIVGNVGFLNKMQDIFISEGIANRVTLKAIHRTPKRTWGNLIYRGIYRCTDITGYLYRDATIWLPRKKDRIDSWPKPKKRRDYRSKSPLRQL